MRTAAVVLEVEVEAGEGYGPGVPEVLRTRGFRFFFFSREGHEPRHIHIERAEKYPKYWLEPIALAESRAFRSHELTLIRRMIEENRDEFINARGRHHHP